MTSSLRKATLLVGVFIVAAVGLAGIGNATSLGIAEIARNHELDEGAKNHGAVVSEAAKHHGGGVSLLNSQRTFSSQSILVPASSQSTFAADSGRFSQSALASPQSVSSVQSIPEPGTLLLLGTGMLGFASWRARRGIADSRR